MKEVIEQFSNPLFVTDLVLSACILILITIYLCYHMKRKIVTISLIVAIPLILALKVFELQMAFQIILIAYLAFVLFSSIVNIAEFRYHYLNNVHIKRKDKKDDQVAQEELYKHIYNAVSYLSKAKTGAIITFERGDSLDEIMSNGTKINAPVSAELLETIFYPGTRLHDGAVIIRDNDIIAASVYFTPTNRPLTGKYGSRHRAAFGISEITDSVTVVVSEETGRISIAHRAVMERVSLDQFLDEFTSVMEDK